MKDIAGTKGVFNSIGFVRLNGKRKKEYQH